MNLTACFPGKYIQGEGTIEELDILINKFGNKALLLTSPSAKKQLPEKYLQSTLSKNINIEIFGGECCEEEIESLCKKIKQNKIDLVIGMGGGKVIDTAKIAADRTDKSVIIVPTIASTDAPCSGCAVTYTKEGVFENVFYQKLNPSVVIVDVEIISKAPSRFLVAGMGDALATWFEAKSCYDNGSLNECGGLCSLTGLNLAKLCYDVLLKDGLKAKLDIESGIITKAVHNIIEANILLSGIGFESGGLASAHAIHNGLTVLPETHSFYHGEKVAFGLLTGLHLNNHSPEEIKEVYDFCLSIGLPISLSEIGINTVNKEKMMLIAEKSTEIGSSIHHEKNKITAEMVYEALIKADDYGKNILKALKI